MKRELVLAFLLLVVVASAQAQEDEQPAVINAPVSDVSDILDAFVGQTIQLNDTQNVDTLLNIVTPIRVRINFSDTAQIYEFALSTEKTFTVLQETNQSQDLRVDVPQSVVNELLQDENITPDDMKTFLSNPALVFYPHTFKVDLALTNIEALFDIDLHVVREDVSVKALHVISVIVATFVNILNSIFWFIKI
ncbi:hypothetical protein COT72_02365 [archaeon CG10_big_fil_rev_8_21_14_0_10_43_11]|nr:MAG: hypothetical protein COT72_02365 [archaeon CG10_big_fil_rev_8_21_14_0_10_43_11]